ncbi:unnamed protein product, partial [Scytosiphon promiscuus]
GGVARCSSPAAVGRTDGELRAVGGGAVPVESAGEVAARTGTAGGLATADGLLAAPLFETPSSGRMRYPDKSQTISTPVSAHEQMHMAEVHLCAVDQAGGLVAEALSEVIAVSERRLGSDVEPHNCAWPVDLRRPDGEHRGAR